MAVSRKDGIHTVVFDDTADTVLGGVEQGQIGSGTEVASEPTGGEIYARHQSVNYQDWRANWRTRAIAEALDVVGITGLNIGGLATGIVLYSHRHAIGSTRAGATSHRTFTMADGLCHNGVLSCTLGQDATLTQMAIPISIAGADPVVEADAVSLPAGFDDAERFTLGPVTINGVALTHLRSFELNFGIQASVERDGTDAVVYNSFVSIDQIVPVLTLRGIDVEWMKSTNIPRAGLNTAHASTAIYLRKRALGSTFVAANTAEHIKFTACGIAYIDVPFDGQGPGAAECTLMLPMRFDGTNAPFTVDTAIAIT